MNKLVFIGGHHNSALATIDWLKDNFEDNEYYWIGKKFSAVDKVSPEFSEVSKKNIPFYNLNAGKLFRTTSLAYSLHVIYHLLLIPFGFFQAFYYLSKIKPDLIISFGGYLSVPVIVAGRLMGIKSVLHEQTATIGLANSISAKFSQKIFTAWPEDFYSDESESVKRKIEYTGLPIRKSLSLSQEKIVFPREKFTIYITGGKSGSLFINQIMLDSLNEIVEHFNLIWSTGRRVGEADYESVIESINKLPNEIQENILVKEYFLEDEIGKIFNTADFLITRGGAHTIYELALIKKPALVIPIPWVSKQEQLKNANILKSFGLAEVLDQEELTPYTLVSEIEAFSHRLEEIKESVSNKELVPANGQEKLGYAIMEFFQK